MAKNNEQPLVSEDQVWEVMNFAKYLYNGYFTPDLVNSKMKEANLTPRDLSREQIDKALRTPNESERELVNLSEYYRLVDNLYKRMLDYYSKLPSWDWTYQPVGEDLAVEDFTKPAYLRDEKTVDSFMSKFNYKKEFQEILGILLTDEVYFGVLRENGDGTFFFQRLPSEWCRITGRFEYGFLFDFDMNYFIQAGVDINMFPPIFKKYYNEVMGARKRQVYKPTASFDRRNGEFAYWHQTSPMDGFFCFKFSPEYATITPYFSSMFPDMALKPIMRQLQLDKDIAIATKLLVGLIGFNKDNKSGNVKNAFNIDPETLGQFMGLVNESLGRAIKAVTLPLADVKEVNFETSNPANLYEKYLTTVTSMSGGNTRLLYSTDRMNAEETRLASEIDEMFATKVYPYFADFVNFQINIRTKKYTFKVTFEGSKFSGDRDRRMEIAMKLGEKGIVDHQLFASAIGISPFDFIKRIELTSSKKFIDKLTPMMSGSQMSGSDQGGAPTKPDRKTSDAGSKNREYQKSSTTIKENIEVGGGNTE